MHWTWYQPTATTKPNYDCALAYNAYAYGEYTGGISSEEVKSMANYQVRRAVGVGLRGRWGLVASWLALQCAGSI